MIVAKAANMGLVLFFRRGNSKWYEAGQNPNPNWYEETNYFLCLPQHKETCLHWLNGGDVLVEDVRGEYLYAPVYGNNYVWSSCILFMDETKKIRIKPKKEKRWIAVYKEEYAVTGEVRYFNTELSYKSIDELKSRVHAVRSWDDYQFIEIEIEV